MVIRTHNISGIPWYNHDKDELNESIEWCFKHYVGTKNLPGESNSNKKLSKLLGIVSPHAGYSCSGPHASHGYFELSYHANIETVIVLGTNHTGLGSPTSLFPIGEWQTPLGSLEIDKELHFSFSELIKSNAKDIGFKIEPDAHLNEHSIDNQLPFLQYTIKNEFKILPLAMGDHSLSTCLIIAEVLAKIMSSTQKNVVIVASSDFTHYLSPIQAESKDKPVLQYLQNYNLEEAVKAKNRSDATICGFGPVLTLFAVAKKLNLLKNELLIYGHSGQTCGDSRRVVAYASIILGS